MLCWQTAGFGLLNTVRRPSYRRTGKLGRCGSTQMAHKGRIRTQLPAPAAATGTCSSETKRTCVHFGLRPRKHRSHRRSWLRFGSIRYLACSRLICLDAFRESVPHVTFACGELAAMSSIPNFLTHAAKLRFRLFFQQKANSDLELRK